MSGARTIPTTRKVRSHTMYARGADGGGRIEELLRQNENLSRRVDELNARLEDALTELKEREEKLSESEEQLRAAFEVATIGMAQVDLTGRYLRVNQKLCDIVGYAEEELLMRNFREITHSDDLDAELDCVRRTLKGEKEAYSMEKRYIRQDRERVWANLSASLLRGSSGEPRCFIQAVEDITRRKEAQRVLQTLAPREVEVLGHLALGKTNPEIAASTNFSLGSVKLQIREIIHKLDISDRTQAAVRAVELGLLASGWRPPKPGRRYKKTETRKKISGLM